MLTKPIVYMLCGAPGAGKSWVVKQLIKAITNKFIYISYDDNPKRLHISLLKKSLDKPVIYDPTFKISTIIKRHSNIIEFRPVFIVESEETLKERMSLRGGTWTDTILKRNNQMIKRHKKYGGFIGNSTEVFNYLLKELENFNG
jgi:deoxyadenosine/deoxycytidine kinase